MILRKDCLFLVRKRTKAVRFLLAICLLMTLIMKCRFQRISIIFKFVG